jgi:hypothetical protein
MYSSFNLQTIKLADQLATPDLHPQVQKNILRLILLRDGVSPASILEEIAPWSPPEQLFYLEYLILKISQRISQAIMCEPQKPVLTDMNYYRVDFKLSLRDEVFTSLPTVVYFVELDSRAFHDRTRVEFIRERQRLRKLQRAGGKVYTFAAEEVFRNVSKCVLETITALERELVQRRHMITSALCQ